MATILKPYIRRERKYRRIKNEKKHPTFWGDVEQMYLHKGWIIKDFIEHVLRVLKNKKGPNY
jgi:hypothetical protein